MAFTDMNDVEQELGEEKPPDRNGNRTFLIIAGTLGGIMVLALLCIAALALFRYLPNQRAAQNANATNAAQATAIAFAASQTAAAPTATATKRPTLVPTNTQAPTKTPVIVLAPTKSPTLDLAVATRNALLTQAAASAQPSAQPSATALRPTSTALPGTGIADEMGTPGLITAAFVLVVIIFLMRRLRTAS
jgi:type II secretory pathway pseudopilin PulG